jgi:RNA polymerase sigma-70 factor (ECF subfamily)
MHDDKQLISRCIEGNEDAWLTIYHRIYKPVYFISRWRKWGFSPEQSEEVMQEIFIGIIHALKTFKGDCSLETFASNIAKKKCISELRKITAAKREGDGSSVPIQDMEHALFSGGLSAQNRLEQLELKEILKEAFDEIGEPCAEILRLRYYDNHSYDEIARRMEVAAGTVGSRLQRCLLRLKELCEQRTD